MRKYAALVALAAALGVAGGARAQFSINAGYYGLQLFQHVEAAGKSLDTTASLGGGFYAGLAYNIRTDGPLGIIVGAYFTNNSSVEVQEQSVSMGPITLTSRSMRTVSMMGVSVPLHLGYRHHFSDRFTLLAELGPTLDVGISALEQNVSTASMLGVDSTLSIQTDIFGKREGESGPYLTRVGLELTAQVGVQLRGFRLMLGYSYGVTDRCGYPDRGRYAYTFHTGRYFAGVGYEF